MLLCVFLGCCEQLLVLILKRFRNLEGFFRMVPLSLHWTERSLFGGLILYKSIIMMVLSSFDYILICSHLFLGLFRFLPMYLLLIQILWLSVETIEEMFLLVYLPEKCIIGRLQKDDISTVPSGFHHGLSFCPQFIVTKPRMCWLQIVMIFIT